MAGTGVPPVTMQIEQTDTTLALSQTLDNGEVLRAVYPTDGTTTRQKLGRSFVRRTGHWEGSTLILETTGRFRFRDRTTREVLALANNGKVMKMSFHVLGGDSRRDHEATFERVRE